MSPSEIEELLAMDPFKPFRLTLSSGDQITVDADDRPFVAGAALVLRGDRNAGRITSGSRMVSIVNIALIEPVDRRPTGRRRRT